MGQLELLYTNSFKKDTKKFKNNNLRDWKDYFECHIMPDVLLIYQVIDNKYLKLIRLGSYSDLFN